MSTRPIRRRMSFVSLSRLATARRSAGFRAIPFRPCGLRLRTIRTGPHTRTTPSLRSRSASSSCRATAFRSFRHERHRCTQAAALALALPAKLEKLADVMAFKHRKDKAGERLMHRMTKPRKPRKGEDPNGTYWVEDANGEKILRLSDYNCVDVEVEREADGRVGRLSDYEQKVWLLSNVINERGFHIDRAFAEAARKIAEAAGPEINAELAHLTDGAVTTINQVKRLKAWLKIWKVDAPSLDSDAIEELLEGDLDGPVRRVLELRAGGAQAAVKKIGALLARAGADDRIRGAFRYHGASTGRWSGEGFQPQNLKRPESQRTSTPRYQR